MSASSSDFPLEWEKGHILKLVLTALHEKVKAHQSFFLYLNQALKRGIGQKTLLQDSLSFEKQIMSPSRLDPRVPLINVKD